MCPTTAYPVDKPEIMTRLKLDNKWCAVADADTKRRSL